MSSIYALTPKRINNTIQVEVMQQMIEIKRKSIVPVYGVAAVWVLYCVVFPLYKTWHFIVLACSAAVVYFILSQIF